VKWFQVQYLFPDYHWKYNYLTVIKNATPTVALFIYVNEGEQQGKMELECWSKHERKPFFS